MLWNYTRFTEEIVKYLSMMVITALYYLKLSHVKRFRFYSIFLQYLNNS